MNGKELCSISRCGVALLGEHYFATFGAGRSSDESPLCCINYIAAFGPTNQYVCAPAENDQNYGRDALTKCSA